MIQLPGYELGAVVFRNANTAVYRGTHDDRAVMIKVPVGRATNRVQERYAHAWRIGRQFKADPFVVEHLALESTATEIALITEDFGGTALDQVLSDRRLSLREALNIAISVAKALSTIHQRNIIHKDLCPGNIATCVKTGATKLLDFSISSQLSREKAALQSERLIEGTLAYLSPERTGRMNRPVDYRSDFYSFGVTLYQMLTGELPFDSADPLELVHAHIARNPVPACERDPKVPKQLSDLVGRLMAKTPEDRYRGAYGLRRDLEECQVALEEAGGVRAFALGSNDVDHRFNLPHTLYGRQAEIERLERAVDGSAGDRSVFLIGGVPGIGKSALVQEVHKPLAARHGAYCAGKFDQFRRDLPYSAIRDAVADLLRQRLNDPPDEVQQLSERLREGLGENAGVITAVLPDVAALVGDVPPPPEVGPTEARFRFDRAFKAMMQALVSPERPLVVFLDDLHWADLPSLYLLGMLGADRALSGLVLIGAYRDNEAGPTHPLWDAVRSIEANGVPVDRMTLGPLSVQDTTELCADALQREADDVRGLSELVHRKTAGNPFFVSAFMQQLYRKNLLNFVPDKGRWSWDLERAAALESTDNVIALVTERLKDLPADTQAVLQAASCIGSSFDLRTVSSVALTTTGRGMVAILPALEAELVVPLDDDYKYVQSKEEISTLDSANPRFAFLHDRVQQAVHARSASRSCTSPWAGAASTRPPKPWAPIWSTSSTT